ncbi:accessory Sec system glycosyltransferase Asp1 [Staphylococcus aureus]|nr:accessory Sec system glycosyltransferase Asp1 [Staphylococcus aureus]
MEIVYFIEDLKNGRVTVSKDINITINKQNITIWLRLIEEKFQAMIAHQIHEDDHVIVASDARHNRQIANHIPAKSLSYSFFKNRNETVSDEEYQSIVKNAH